MRSHWPWIVVLAVALVGAIVADVSPPNFAAASKDWKSRNPHYVGVRFIRDDHDLNVYYQRSAYARTPGAKPYKDVFSEYPELATYLFAVPCLTGSSRPGYQTGFLLLMALALGGLAAVTGALCRACGSPPARTLLLLLPGCFYFALSRYDVVAALVTCAAILFLVRGRPSLAFALLAVAFLTKAYPVVLGPLFAGYTVRRHGWRAAAVAAATFVAVVAVPSLQLALWAGPNAVVSPFAYQLGRAGNAESLYFFVSPYLPAAQPLFLLAQGALAVYYAFAVPRTTRGVILAAAAIVMSFALFTRFQSPQWVLWTSPLVLAAARTRGQLSLVVAMDLLTYLYYPIAWDTYGSSSQPFSFVLGVFATVRVCLLVVLIAEARRETP